MKFKTIPRRGACATAGHRLGHACLKTCQTILAQIGKAKDAIFAEARHRLPAREQLLRLALNEAEALAWQTLYPHLLFPALATEKVERVAVWDSRQRILGRQARSMPFEN